MYLRDALVPFRFAGTAIPQDFAHAPTPIRVAFLSEHLQLKASMQRTLPPGRYTLTQVCSTSLVEKAIEKESCDVAIVDIERENEWPDSVFSRFDEAAASFPIIVLCKTRHQILSYLWKAQHVIDILSYEFIDDPRFLAVIEAAAFRAEITRDIEVEDLSEPRYPPAA